MLPDTLEQNIEEQRMVDGALTGLRGKLGNPGIDRILYLKTTVRLQFKKI